ncbi:MAG: DUF1080 domain-containing protein, partial [Alistipes sp.]|nr:DUF1080 domain-containing protein [Alistipes sp.]
RLGGAEVPQALAEVMTSQEEQNAAAAQACLMAYKGNINAVAAALVTKNQDVRGLHLLAARGAKDQANVIFAAAESSNDDFAQAACEALPQVVGAASRERLCTLLEKQTSVKDPKTLALQDALVMALKQEIAESKATEAQVREEIEKFLSQHSSKATLYYGVLAKADLPGAMERITEGFSAARSQVDKDNAFYGLLNLKGMAAAETLLSIAQGSDADYAARAAEAYLQIVSQSAMTSENKVLKIEDLLETLRTNAALASLSAKLKSAALQQVEQNQCFQGLILAGGYLEAPEAEVRQAAVMAVIRTALAHKEYYGSAVTALLNQAVAANKDKDSGYQKEEVAKHLASLPTDEGFVSMFNGVDLTGWKGLIENPIARAAMKPAELAKRQKEADATMRNEWVVREGLLEFTGTGFNNICTAKDYGNFEMYLDWKLYEGPEPDAGIYLRGTPQVQMWDTSRRNVGAEVGSGGLYNNQVNPSKPSHVADNKVGAWNTYYIKMVGDRVTVVLNGEKVVTTSS